jgi:hypothetical protein
LGEPGEEWHVAPAWQKDSIRNAVAFWMELGPEEPNIEALSHENWKRQRLAAGWRYGPVKDVELKTHPCLSAYEDLSPAQRHKDHVVVQAFRAVAPQVAALMSKQ